jgi:penicillin-binding protein 1A
MAQTLGLTTPIFPNYASALGASEVTLMELTRAYSVFPNQGTLVDPVFIQRIEDRDGRVLAENHLQKHQVLNPSTAQTMTQLMMGVVERGTGARVKVLGRPMGGKTGTTNRTRDAWFIGFTPSVITGTWVGWTTSAAWAQGDRFSGRRPHLYRLHEGSPEGQPGGQFPNRRPPSGPGAEGQARDDEEGAASEDFYPEDALIQEKAQTETPGLQPAILQERSDD